MKVREREKERERYFHCRYSCRSLSPSLPVAVVIAVGPSRRRCLSQSRVTVGAAPRRCGSLASSSQGFSLSDQYLEIRNTNLVLLRHRNLLLHLVRFSTEMENMNFEEFLIKPRKFWLNKSTINLYSSLNGLPETAKICIPGVTREDEFHFLVGGKVAKFTKREFCLVTDLKFGVMSDIFFKTYHVISGGIHDRYFAGDENLQLKHVWEKFIGDQFEEPQDGLKMALILIANNVWFGQDLRRKVSLWLFALVEDLKSFDSFQWGIYVYMMTIHYLRQGFRSVNASRKVVAHYNLYGFPWTLLFWAMEACSSLVELVRNNLCHSHPRLKNWRIFKRPNNFFAKFAKYEQEVKEGKHVVLEVLTPTNDEKIQPYLVGVDTNLSEGLQFVPLNYDNGEQRPNDYGNDDGNADGNDDDVDVDVDVDVDIADDDHANDEGQSRPKQMKRKMFP
ncbi:hypothetical protein Ddye_020756 [Dipteronia dyeriana]|uniref:DUF1985 domain-containing protein n=1 Tax=Dipteronia dyeriana TaxID=168575 RepID=A0AAD9U147_9ROSI|nr:hypothetical protein Ddye_020756 [Dipteronia dyeriana]